jgi:hypothetical protein
MGKRKLAVEDDDQNQVNVNEEQSIKDRLRPLKKANVNEEEKVSNYVCQCGYNTDTPLSLENIQENKCANTMALLNHIKFPPLKLLSVKDKPELSPHYNVTKKVPNKHWCLLIEIEAVSFGKNSYTLTGKTIYDEKVLVKFSDDCQTTSTTFKWSDLSKGKTLAILYAHKQSGDSGEESSNTVVVSNRDNCFVFNASLNATIDMASLILENEDLGSDKVLGSDLVCFNCDRHIRKNNEEFSQYLEKKEPQSCLKCKRYVFCGKVFIGAFLNRLIYYRY